MSTGGEVYAEEEIKENLSRAKQWMIDIEGTYELSPETTGTLKPGFYRPVETRRSVGLQPIDVNFDELINLETQIQKTLFKDFVDFWDKEEQIRELGFKHRRGILLYGPPGSGKTSIVNMLSKIVVENKSGYVLLGNTHPALIRAGLSMIRQIHPSTPVILLMEDIDELVNKDKYGSEYLSILDGQDSCDNIVIIATTNYIERLEDRIKDRPGRFDRVCLVDNPSYDVRKRFLLEKNVDTDSLEKWVEKTNGWSLAHLKELIVSTQVLGEDPEESFERINDMKIQKSSTETSGKKLGFRN